MAYGLWLMAYGLWLMAYILENYADVFNGGLGILPGTIHLIMKPHAEPVIRTPKRIPVELKERTKAEVDRMVKLGVFGCS